MQFSNIVTAYELGIIGFEEAKNRMCLLFNINISLYLN